MGDAKWYVFSYVMMRTSCFLWDDGWINIVLDTDVDNEDSMIEQTICKHVSLIEHGIPSRR